MLTLFWYMQLTGNRSYCITALLYCCACPADLWHVRGFDPTTSLAERPFTPPGTAA